jgi:hypothetical protein
MKSFGLVFVASLVAPLLASAGCASDAAGLSLQTTSGREPEAAAPGPGAPPVAGGALDPMNAQGAPVQGEPPAEINLPRCGPPPYQAVTLRARDIQAPAGKEPAGVAITLKLCPDQKFTIGEDGQAVVLVTIGAETWICFQAPGYLPWMVGEMAVSDALPGNIVGTLVPRSLASTVTPGYQPESPLVLVEVQAGRATGAEACRAREGVVLAVKDHPGATVLYRAMGSNGSYQRTAGTSPEGVAIVTGLPANAGPVELVAQKTGCSYTLSYGDVNSPALVPIVRTPLSPGVITFQTINPAR